MRRALLLIAACLAPLSCGAPRSPWRLTPGRLGIRLEAAEVRTLGGGYDRLGSRVLLRRVIRATRANLDFACHHANVMLQRPPPDPPVAPARGGVDPGALFGGVLVPGSLVASLAQTPLTAEERRHPMAFSPMVDFLAEKDADAASGLEEARTEVSSEGWGAPGSEREPRQQIALAFLHHGDGQPQLWIMIELQPWAHLFRELPDEDGDGYPQLYARLRPDLVPAKVVDLIRREYRDRTLDAVGVRTWANELASYWYPSYNTDVTKLQDPSVWPPTEMRPTIAREVARLAPTQLPPGTLLVAIRGKPRGQPLYTVLVVEGVTGTAGGSKGTPRKQPGSAAPGSAAPTDTARRHPATRPSPRRVTPRPGPVLAALRAEARRHGGTWQDWAKAVAPVHREIAAMLARRPKQLAALKGRGGFLFYRRSLDYVVAGDLEQQPKGKNPLPTIVAFKNDLRRLGVDFLLVPVPTKAEVFPDRLLGPQRLRHLLGARSHAYPVLSPYGRKLLARLSEAGVEVVDLLPLFLRARQSSATEPLYQPHDTHWTSRGLQLVAEALAQRIKAYPWAQSLVQQPVAYRVKRVTFTRRGDLVSRLEPRERRGLRPQRLEGHQVLTPQGALYDDDPESPVVILGDSFTGVYQRIDCRGAGVSAHLARLLGHPVDLVMSYGGGPNVRRALLSRGIDSLRTKRLVIWLFAARDLFDYWDDWEPLPITPEPQP